MRDIKFRAWDEKNKRMIYNLRMFDLSDADEKLSIAELEECPLMQYTELKDKNGKEIYENDIVLVPYNRFGNIIVEYKEGTPVISKYKVSECRVVGNIYETPELKGRYASMEKYEQINRQRNK